MDSEEIKRLAAEVSVQHGIRVDADDPLMAVVTMNRLMFERAIGDACLLIGNATKDFNCAVERVQLRAGSAIAQEVRESIVRFRAEIQKDLEGARLNARDRTEQLYQVHARRWLWLSFGLLAGVGLFAAGVSVGMFMR
jgi:hypothetical protein